MESRTEEEGALISVLSMLRGFLLLGPVTFLLLGPVTYVPFVD
jgi:hypothetical protein